MKKGLLQEDHEMKSQPGLQRRRMFTATHTTAAGLGLQALVSADALAAERHQRGPRGHRLADAVI